MATHTYAQQPPPQSSSSSHLASAGELGRAIATPVLLEAPGATTSPQLDGAGLHVGLVYTRESWDVVEALVTACRGELMLKGVARGAICELQVSLPFELPYAAQRLVASAPARLDAVVAVGCMVRGATLSFEFVAEAVARALMEVGMRTRTPVIYGVLTCSDAQQARACAGLAREGSAPACSYGVEWAQSAIEMARLNLGLRRAEAASCACACHAGACACADKRHSGGGGKQAAGGAEKSEGHFGKHAHEHEHPHERKHEYKHEHGRGHKEGKEGACGACGCKEGHGEHHK